jgi:chromosome segregation protein
MLKALELIGFKSFADRTRFEFPAGVTAIVGPNGSGKSNVVDAIKWVLGEQSVKSLRGKEMADVIFNGSGSREGLNSAETTLTFDNAEGLLPIDAPEAHITRRIYRSGESEYLINRQPCRLRDIRDLFSGTGAATEAYSVIEQGKVDVLLQSSPRERRSIFEEAAGISRFKAKKIESLRRLARVEQNLLRLADIVEEVDHRLRMVRKQASKAQRYRENADRLQELRTQVGLADWRRLGDQLEAVESEILQIRQSSTERNAQADELEQQVQQCDDQLVETRAGIHQTETQMADNREAIVQREATVTHLLQRIADLEQEGHRHQNQMSTFRSRAGDLRQQIDETIGNVQQAEATFAEHHQMVDEIEADLSELADQIQALRSEDQQRRKAYMDRMKAAGELGNQVSALESRAASIDETHAECQRRLDDIQDELDLLEGLREQATAQLSALESEAETLANARQSADDRVNRRLSQLNDQREELQQRKQRQAATKERAALLEELEDRQEGLGEGVKQILDRARNDEQGPYRFVHGLVADLLQVPVEMAPLIDVALGEAEQYLVATDAAALREPLRAEAYRLQGRVSVVWLDLDPPTSLLDELNLSGQRGVLGRADQFVETEEAYRALTRRLLGRTWIVETLDDAVRLAAGLGRGLRYVTVAGETLREDGVLTVGPRQTLSGLLARRSELRALRDQLVQIQQEVARTQSEITESESLLELDRQLRDEAIATHLTAHEAVAEVRLRRTALTDQDQQWQRQRATVEIQREASLTQRASLTEELTSLQESRQQVDRELAALESDLAGAVHKLEQTRQHQQRRGEEATACKVRLAKSEQHLENLLQQQSRLEQEQEERHRGVEDVRRHLAECEQSVLTAERRILEAESTLAELYLSKEHLAREAARLDEQSQSLQRQRGELTQHVQRLRNEIRKLEEKVHGKDLAANEFRHERHTLASRLRDDYGIELAELEHEPTDEELHQREEVESEITDLRHKLNTLGNVNLDALEELDELEQRYQTLSTQYQDLVDAKDALQQIINKINGDSRRLFAETLETVRGHFRTLFRSLFGGGQADIILEDELDILESGIEIVARPPGKEPRSISLLSGGEKTLTCVALLLAIFRSRPSPFCVLDEVDAALDEANIERFINVLNEFLSWTQFIIVTHSKKTMTCANTLYGVTMEESGVSKRVSVRFDDIHGEGEITWADMVPDDAPQQDEEDTQAA